VTIEPTIAIIVGVVAAVVGGMWVWMSKQLQALDVRLRVVENVQAGLLSKLPEIREAQGDMRLEMKGIASEIRAIHDAIIKHLNNDVRNAKGGQ
jgi:hypothetical protein